MKFDSLPLLIGQLFKQIITRRIFQTGHLFNRFKKFVVRFRFDPRSDLRSDTGQDIAIIGSWWSFRSPIIRSWSFKYVAYGLFSEACDKLSSCILCIKNFQQLLFKESNAWTTNKEVNYWFFCHHVHHKLGKTGRLK